MSSAERGLDAGPADGEGIWFPPGEEEPERFLVKNGDHLRFIQLDAISPV